MIREIVLYPDPILQRPTEKIVAFDEELRTLAADMFDSMYKAIGIGLAAPQIGVSKRITVIDVSNKTDPEDKIILVNPEIIHREGKQVGEEGCLSLPDIRDKVTRAAKVTVKAQDLDGNWFEKDGEELLARAMQHEIDHLDGILFPWRVSALKRDFILRKIRKLQKTGEWK